MTTTADLTANIIAQLEGQLGQSVPLLPKSFLRVLAKVMAAVYIQLYKYIGFGLLQGFVQTASALPTLVNGRTITPLEFWGDLIGVGLPRRATQAELTLTITVQQTGSLLPSGTQLVNPQTGVTYITLASVALSASSVPVQARAAGAQDGSNGAGARGNLANASELTFANPLAGVARVAVVTGTLVTGAEAEDPEVYRQRVVNRFRARPQGGALADYRAWGVEPAGVREVYPYRATLCNGQVDVFVQAITGNPTTDQLNAVMASIMQADRCPVGALPVVHASPVRVFNVTVQGLVTPDAPGTQAAIISALSDYLATRRPFIEGLDFPPASNRISESSLSAVVEEVCSYRGASFTSLAVAVGVSLVSAYTLGRGEIPQLGAVAYV